MNKEKLQKISTLDSGAGLWNTSYFETCTRDLVVGNSSSFLWGFGQWSQSFENGFKEVMKIQEVLSEEFLCQFFLIA